MSKKNIEVILTSEHKIVVVPNRVESYPSTLELHNSSMKVADIWIKITNSKIVLDPRSDAVLRAFGLIEIFNSKEQELLEKLK